MTTPSRIANSTEVGRLGVPHLKRIWSAAEAERAGQPNGRVDEGRLDVVVLNALGLGLHQTMQHLFSEAPTFEAFESWVVATAGPPDQLSVDRLTTMFHGSPPSHAAQQFLASVNDAEPVFTEADLSFWQTQGYVILKNAISEQDSARALTAICEHVGADLHVRDSWYSTNATGIMVELIQHPDLARNRRSVRIHKAFSQLWETADLWVSADRCGFHPPQHEGWPFPGPDLHWDISLDQPLEFGTQGLLYLTETPPEQGALTLVPGFHRRIAPWLASRSSGQDPNPQELHGLGSIAVGGGPGDLLIWNHALPHGSRPNLGKQPRVVQYINMIPGTGGPLTA